MQEAQMVACEDEWLFRLQREQSALYFFAFLVLNSSMFID